MAFSALCMRNSTKVLPFRRFAPVHSIVSRPATRDVTTSSTSKQTIHTTPRALQQPKLAASSLRKILANSRTVPDSQSRHNATMASKSQYAMSTSGETLSVWTHLLPFSELPKFPSLTHDLQTDTVIIGAGIAGIQTAYELVKRGKQVVLLEARDVLSGETGRTSGHLNNDLDDGYIEIANKHGKEGAQIAAESHAWARDRVEEIVKELGIECEYRKLPAYDVSQYPRGQKGWEDELKELKEEAKTQASLGMESRFDENLTVRGWSGKVDQRGGMIVGNQAAFHPTRYLAGVLEWLKKQPNFQCFTRTRVMSVEEHGVEVLGLGHKSVTVQTESGHTVKAEQAVEATCVPLQKLAVITQLEFFRTYCIAARVPKGSVEDCLLYDNAEHYKYVRLTACDEKDDYLIVGGCDHKVGQEETTPRFDELEKWTRERFPQATTVDYRWSGQIFDPVDHMGLVGKNQGNQKIYIITGDSGDGLTNGVLAGRLIADEIDGVDNKWAKLYSPKRLGSMLKSLPSMISHDVQINAQYKRFLQTDIVDIEDLVPGSGGVLNPKTGKPVAVYKDENGKVSQFSALCPHLKGVVCWNAVEKSFDCPVHGSRFSKEGICVTGPAKANLSPSDAPGQVAQEVAAA